MSIARSGAVPVPRAWAVAMQACLQWLADAYRGSRDTRYAGLLARLIESEGDGIAVPREVFDWTVEAARTAWSNTLKAEYRDLLIFLERPGQAIAAAPGDRGAPKP